MGRGSIRSFCLDFFLQGFCIDLLLAEGRLKEKDVSDIIFSALFSLVHKSQVIYITSFY